MALIFELKTEGVKRLRDLLIKGLLIIGFSVSCAFPARALVESDLCKFKPVNINENNLSVQDMEYNVHTSLDKELLLFIEEALKEELVQKLEKFVVDKALIIISEQINSKVFDKLVLETYPKVLYYANVLNAVVNGTDKDKAYLAANAAIQSMNLTLTGELISTTILTVMQIIDYSKDKAHYEQLKKIYEEVNSINNTKNNNLQKYALILSIKISMFLEEYYVSKINLSNLYEVIDKCSEENFSERKKLFFYRKAILQREVKILNSLLGIDEQILMLATNNIMTHEKISQELKVKTKNAEDANSDFIAFSKQIQNLNFEFLKQQLSLLQSSSENLDFSFNCARHYRSVLDKVIENDSDIILKSELNQCRDHASDFTSSLIKNTVASQLKTLCKEFEKYYLCHVKEAL